jgi:hypothetical protein|tara:strand:+ start:225 stop:1436 length:1212 start_codon:yes stop_codon:yes gene_type:complete
MAIDWGRVAKGVTTGYLSAKIANTEANDKMNANIIEKAGINFYTNRMPEFYKTEKMIEKEFKQISSMWGQDFANAAADEGWITGDGNSFNNIASILKTKNIDKNFYKGKKFSTFAERKTGRLEGIQSEERMIKELSTGSSKIGPTTIKSQIEGLGTVDTAAVDTAAVDTAVETQPANIPGTPIVPIQERSTMEQDVSSGTLFTSKGADVKGTQARYKHIANAVNELGGYTENIVWGEGGTLNLNLFGERRNEAGAHIALANKLTITKPEEYNQYNAAPAAEQWLNTITVQPFKNIANELKLTYDTGATGGNKADAMMGDIGSVIDANKTLANGLTINSTILQTLDLIPLGPSGEPNNAVLSRFIENIPKQLEITIGGDTQNYKQYMSNLIGMRNSGFWSNYKG